MKTVYPLQTKFAGGIKSRHHFQEKKIVEGEELSAMITNISSQSVFNRFEYAGDKKNPLVRS